MACSGDSESAAEYYEASMKEHSLNYCSTVIYLFSLTSVQTCIVFVEHEDCWQRMFMMHVYVSYNASEWAWTTIMLQI